jgi:tRNA-2-methylthio-N6-dimethylallyladenosine synthase
VKKIHMETWGCQMNVADSEHMLALMANKNYMLVENPGEADVIVLNTCHIREKATHKVLSRLGVLKELKVNNPELTIAVAGCVAQAEGKKLLEKAPVIDVLLGPGKITELPDLIEAHQNSGKQTTALGFAPDRGHGEQIAEDEFDLPPVEPLTGKNESSRYVNIQQGCDNFCTFCVVPFTRGREISDMPEKIEKKVQALLTQGAKEITVLGQNVNSYGLDLVRKGLLTPSADGPFVDLLRQLARIDGLSRLRFTTSNPHDFSPALAQLFAEESKLGKYIHLPVQSGSNHILEVMRRKVTREQYEERVQWLRQAIPDMALSTDLIVGFPGESEEDFAATYDLVEKVRFSFIFAFMYSSRKNTAAARFKNQVADEVKSERLARLNALQEKITLEHHQAEIGQDRVVLIQYPNRKEENVYYGRTEHFRLVRVKSKVDIVGRELGVRITGGNKTSLEGEVF